MSYEAITDDLVTILQGMSRFANADVSKGDVRKLVHGKSDCVFIFPGPFTVEDEDKKGISANREVRIWTIYLDIFKRISTNPGTDWKAFGAARDDVIAEMRKYPNMNQSASFIKNVEVQAKNDAVYVDDDQDRGPFFITQRIAVIVTEAVAVTGGDYG